VQRLIPRPGARSAWLVTIIATAASTYALDAFAVAVGAAVAASGLLAGLDGTVLIAVLCTTYAAWAVGLRANLAANAALLRATGTSTNALSKAAHDVACARAATPRVRALAASAGYVLTELVKEIPYYATAWGATFATDAVTSTDAIAFLAGTNIGAALYAYGLARATRGFLARAAAPAVADDAQAAAAAPAAPAAPAARAATASPPALSAR
jgi:hypothetical protein